MAPTTNKKDKNKNASPPPGQKSLTSFFGAAKSKKTGEVIQPKVKLQSSIKSGLKKQSAASSAATSNGGSSGASKKKDDETKKATAKENLENSDEKKDLMDTDDDEADDDEMDQKPAAAALKKSNANSKPSRKRVIDDSDSEDEDDDDKEGEVEQQDKEGSEYEEKEEESEQPSDEDEEEEDGSSDDDEPVGDDNNDEIEINDPPKITRRASPTKQQQSSKKSTSNKSSSPPKSKKQKTLTGKPAPSKLSTKSSTNTSNKKSSTLAMQMKSNPKLRTLMSSEVDITSSTSNSDTKLWEDDTPTLYSALCNTLNDIDGVTGRLEIQEMLTELYRKVLWMDGGGGGDGKTEEEGEEEDSEGEEGKEGKSTTGKLKKGDEKQDTKRSDLYTLLYLTSNSVAPKHENVELGVGDSILIKAIGETSGTAPAMIKKKYDREGDLGTVAMTAKGKQKTLVGFGRVSGPKRLTCVDVLKVFKEIVSLCCVYIVVNIYIMSILLMHVI